jgi:hypothetical protein
MENKKTLLELGNYLSKLLHTRYENLNQLQEKISNYLGFNVDFEKSTFTDIDYRIITNLWLGKKEKLLYLDLYYIFDNNNNMYITEFAFDGDYALNKNDLNLIVYGLEK